MQYQNGFGNEYASEAVPGALPLGRNSPQRAPLDLYPELLSGTAFTAPRYENRRTWLYRGQPSVVSGRFFPKEQAHWHSGGDRLMVAPPEPLRWHPKRFDNAATDFIDGMQTLAVSGDTELQQGVAAHVYTAAHSMVRRALVNADGEMLIVPQHGRLLLTTEMGMLEIMPGEIGLIPRGVAFKVELPDGSSRGYVCENYGAHFRLPELGPIGSNGLANPRDFQAPIAHFEKSEGAYEIVKKYGGRFWSGQQNQSPFNVVAWHGNLAPLKYNTANFMTIGSISFDHPDPSIFTVLTSPSERQGSANCDFVIFPPRWLVMENTFRPPWYHRNTMSEFMGLVYGEYDAKPGGFKPGGASLHNSMVPHGPDEEAFKKATSAELKPLKVDNTLAFMFESRWKFIPTEYAMQCPELDHQYADCWANLKSHYKP